MVTAGEGIILNAFFHRYFQTGEGFEVRGIRHRGVDRDGVETDDADFDAVGGAAAGRGEKGFAAARVLREEEVVAGGVVGEAEVYRGVPSAAAGVPADAVEVVTADAVEAVAGEVEPLSVGGQDREDAVGAFRNAGFEGFGGTDAAVAAPFRLPEAVDAGRIGSGEIDVGGFWEPEGRRGERACRAAVGPVRFGEPAAVREGIIAEEIRAGETPPGDDVGLVHEFGHGQAVAREEHPRLDGLHREGVRRGHEAVGLVRQPVQRLVEAVQRFVKTVVAVVFPGESDQRIDRRALGTDGKGRKEGQQQGKEQQAFQLSWF